MAEMAILAMCAATEKVGATVDMAAPDAFACAMAILAAALTGACAASFCFFFGDICDMQTRAALAVAVLTMAEGSGGGEACLLWPCLLHRTSTEAVQG